MRNVCILKILMDINIVIHIMNKSTFRQNAIQESMLNILKMVKLFKCNTFSLNFRDLITDDFSDDQIIKNFDFLRNLLWDG